MSLKNDLCDVRMNMNDTIDSYFMRNYQVRDQLQAIDEIIPEKELVTTTLNGLPESRDSFVAGMCARKEAPKFYELWTACTQEESRLMLRARIQRSEEGGSQAYVARFKKGGGRKKFDFQRRNGGRRLEERRPAPQGKRDTKVQCYHCYKFGHYISVCHERSNDRNRKGNQYVTIAVLDELLKKPKNENPSNK